MNELWGVVADSVQFILYGAGGQPQKRENDEKWITGRGRGREEWLGILFPRLAFFVLLYHK